MYGLKVIVNQHHGETLYSSADVNEDGRIGISEVISILKVVSEVL